MGRWEQVHHCADLVAALNKFGLSATIPSTIGDFFPNESPQQLAKKPDPCTGAKPFIHSHFFDANGSFGSLDQNMQQVDNGRYTIVNDHTMRIGKTAVFHYDITDGGTLTLTPVITPAERKKALADPLRFSQAAWMVAVAYPGTTWKRVSCDGWC